MRHRVGSLLLWAQCCPPGWASQAVSAQGELKGSFSPENFFFNNRFFSNTFKQPTVVSSILESCKTTLPYDFSPR